jgi:LysR family transcriptional regulator, carnitine catabolism transcriptional activator
MIGEMRHIRAFLTVARVHNFTRAANELHVSQSALTVQIKQLEDALGVVLFDRSRRGVSLTQAGKDVLVPLERILIDTEAIISHTRDLAGLRRGVVSIAALPSVAAGLLPSALQEFTKQHPGIAVQILDIVSEKVIEAVKKHQVDFGVGTLTRADRELKATTLFSDRLGAFAPASHLLVRRNSVILKELMKYPLILTGKDSSVREILDNSLQREKLSIVPAFETNYMSTALGMVAAGLGIAILPESAGGLASSAGISCIQIHKPVLSRRIEVIQKVDRCLSPAARSMVNILTRTAASPRR